MPSQSYLLPLTYDITFKINEDGKTFSGSERIDIEITNELNVIVLHCVGLKVNNVKFNDDSVEKVSYEENSQTVTLHVAAQESTKSSISLDFAGEINDHCSGIFSGTIDSHEYWATHFEPLKARFAFPCFDEPELRASFTLHLITQNSGQAVSNSPIEKIEILSNGSRKVSFQETPPMSTYLLAFLVGDFDKKSYDANDIQLNIWTTPDVLDQLDFAGDVAAKSLEFLKNTFNIKYPLVKLDICGIPNFEKSGMENFGIIFLKENNLLVDFESSQFSKEEVAETIIHEIAHQWFGNLVGVKSWDELWLKEAFATWFSWYAIDELFPNWKIWESYMVYTLQSSLMVDARETTHPVYVLKTSIQDVNQDFDIITYQKGCALVTMLSKWLGQDSFLKGISKYLKKWSWKLPSTKDLWDCLREVTGVDVENFMEKWLTLPGYPVVIVEEIDGKIHLHQKRFLLSGQVFLEHENFSYPVCLNIKYSESVDTQRLLESSPISIGIPDDDFYKINNDLVGFFRVAYSEERWEKLGSAVTEGKLSASDRIGLLADSSLLSIAGIVPLVSFFKLVENWSNESNVNVWDEILNDIYNIMDAFVENEVVLKDLEKFLLNLIKEQVKGSLHENPDDSFEQASLKAKIFIAGYTANSPIVSSYCKDQFNSFITELQLINADRRRTVFKSVAKNGDASTFESLKKLYANSKVSVQEDVLSAIGRFESTEILDQVLEYLKNDIPPEDFILTLNSMAVHRRGIEKLWDWLKKEWREIGELLGQESDPHKDVVEACLSGLSTEKHKSEVEDFFKDKGIGFERVYKKAVEKITIKIRWVERDALSLESWFRTKSS